MYDLHLITYSERRIYYTHTSAQIAIDESLHNVY